MKNQKLPLETRQSPVQSFNAKRRTVTVEFSHGAPVRRRAWVSGRGEVEYDEILVVSKNAVNLTRLGAGAPVLDSHNLWSTRSQLAVTENARIEGEVAVCDIRFPREGLDEQSDRMAALVSDSIIKNVSCGYSRDEIRIQPPQKDGEVEKWIVERWTPHEISFVTIGADPAAQVRNADAENDAQYPVIFNRAMPNSKENSAMADGTATPAITPEIKKERERLALIDDLSSRCNLGADWRQRMIAEGASEQSVRNSALNLMAARDEADPSGQRQIIDPFQSMSFDNPSFRAHVIADAIQSRIDPMHKPSAESAELHGRSMAEMIRWSLRQAGVSVIGLGDARVVERGLQMRAGPMSTSDFSIGLESALNKTLLARQQRAPSGIMQVSKRGTARDFRPQGRYRGGVFGQLHALGEGGEIKRGSIPDAAKETLTVETKASLVKITRQAIVNDDMGLFMDLISAASAGSIATQHRILTDIVETPPVLSDGDAVFHANHGNLAGVGAALSEATLSAGRLAMRKQVDLNNERISIGPRFLLVPPELETVAEKLLSQVQATKTADTNPFTTLSLVVESRLTDAAAWYLVADPEEINGLEYAFLDGHEGADIQVRDGWELDGVEIRTVLDFGAAFIDFRGWYKNAGA